MCASFRFDQLQYSVRTVTSRQCHCITAGESREGELTQQPRGIHQRSEHTEQSSHNFSLSTGTVVSRQRVFPCTTRQPFHNTVKHVQHRRLGCREQGNTGHFILHNTSEGIIDLVKNGRYVFNFPPPCSKLNYFTSLHFKECEDPSGQICCPTLCVLVSRWSTMSREQSISELLLSLDSSELQEAEQVRAAVNQQLSSGESTGLSPPVRLPGGLLLYLSICSPDTYLCLLLCLRLLFSACLSSTHLSMFMSTCLSLSVLTCPSPYVRPSFSSCPILVLSDLYLPLPTLLSPPVCPLLCSCLSPSLFVALHCG